MYRHAAILVRLNKYYLLKELKKISYFSINIKKFFFVIKKYDAPSSLFSKNG